MDGTHVPRIRSNTVGRLVWEHRQSPGEGWCIMCVTGQGSMSSRGSNLAGSRDRPAMKSLMALLACFVSTPPPITALVGRPSNVDRPSSCYTSQRPLRPCRWSQSAMDHTCSRRHWGDTDDGRRCHHLPQISPSPSPDPLPPFLVHSTAPSPDCCWLSCLAGESRCFRFLPSRASAILPPSPNTTFMFSQ